MNKEEILSKDEVIEAVWNHFLERESGKKYSGLWFTIAEDIGRRCGFVFDGLVFNGLNGRSIVIGKGKAKRHINLTYIRRGVFSLEFSDLSELDTKMDLEWRGYFFYGPGARLLICEDSPPHEVLAFKRIPTLEERIEKKEKAGEEFSLLPQFIGKWEEEELPIDTSLGVQMLAENPGRAKLPVGYKPEVVDFLIKEFEKLLKGSGF